MKDPNVVSQEDARRVREQYEQALLREKYELAGEIESRYKDTSLRRQLERIKRDIDEALIA